MMLIKKITLIALTIIMLTNQAQAGFWEALDIQQLHDSTTGLQKHVGANGETVRSIGGSLVIKRKTPNYPVWWNFQPPSIQASCSGVSFKGMFGVIANLDAISDQFEEAGSSLAWGVLVGVIYSLPGIGEIFTKLDTWAKKIQNMLANACSVGIAAGKLGSEAVGKKTKEYIEGMSFDVTKYATVPESWYKETSNAVSSILDCNDEIWGKSFAASSCNALKDGVIDKIGSGYAASSPSIFSSVLLNSYEKYSYWPATIEAGKADKIKWDSMKVGISNGFMSDLVFAMVITSAVGDIGVSDKYTKSFISVMNMAKSDKTKSEKKKELAKIKLEYKNQLESAYSISASTSPSNVIKFLIYGSDGHLVGKDGNSTDGNTKLVEDILNELSLPTITFYSEKQEGLSLGSLNVLTSGPMVKSEDLPVELKNYITNYKGVDGVAQANLECFLEGIQSSCNDATSAMVDSDSIRFYAKVVRNTVNKADKEKLKEGYKDLAIFHISYAMLSKVEELIVKISTELKTFSANDNTTTTVDGQNTKSIDSGIPSSNKSITIIKEKLVLISKTFRMILNQNFKNKQVNIHELTQRFKKQNIENLKNAYGKNG